MKTLVLGPAVEDINYRGTGALHTTFPALVQLSPVNADSLEPQAGENRRTLAEGGGVRCPILPTTTTTILLLKTVPTQAISYNTTQDLNSTFTNRFMNTQKWNSKFMNQVSTWDSIKENYRVKTMSSETSKKRRAAAVLAQEREKQIRNITHNEEPIPKDLLPGESMKRTHKLDTICNLQESINPANQRAWIGWIQIEDSATTKAHNMIVKIKLEMEANTPKSSKDPTS
jgi:hypothetical protein